MKSPHRAADRESSKMTTCRQLPRGRRESRRGWVEAGDRRGAIPLRRSSDDEDRRASEKLAPINCVRAPSAAGAAIVRRDRHGLPVPPQCACADMAHILMPVLIPVALSRLPRPPARLHLQRLVRSSGLHHPRVGILDYIIHTCTPACYL